MTSTVGKACFSASYLHHLSGLQRQLPIDVKKHAFNPCGAYMTCLTFSQRDRMCPFLETIPFCSGSKLITVTFPTSHPACHLKDEIRGSTLFTGPVCCKPFFVGLKQLMANTLWIYSLFSTSWRQGRLLLLFKQVKVFTTDSPGWRALWDLYQYISYISDQYI